MASRSESIYKGSEEACYNACDPCKSQGTTSDASAYCTVCAEFLCRTCEKAHRGSKLSRDHKILTGSSMPSIYTKQVPPIMYCDHHKAMTLDLYCDSHEVVICGTCKLTDHRKCKTTEVSQHTKRIKVINACDTSLKQMTALKDKFEDVVKSRNAEKKNVKAQISEGIQDCKVLRKQLNKVMDDLEEKFTKEAALVETTKTKEIENHITIANDALIQINDKIKDLTECLQTKDEDVMFVGMKKSDTVQNKYEAAMSTLEREINPTVIKFTANDAITDILLQLHSLGTVQSKADSSASSESQIQQRHVTSDIRSHASLWNMTVSDRRQIDVGCREVWDCAFVGDSNLVLSCGDDGLKLLDNEYKVQSQLPDFSAKIATINETEIIITQGNLKKLKRVKIQPKMVVTKTMKTDRLCAGVDVYNEDIYITCYDDPGNGEVQIVNMNGKVKRKIGVRDGKYMFSRPDCVKVSKDGSKIFVSDVDMNIITCMSQTGDVLFQHTDEKLKAPVGMCVGVGDTVLVCGGNSHNIHIIKQDGSTHSVVLTEKDGLKHPCSIAYRSRDGQLVVGLWKADKALIVYDTRPFVNH